MDLCFVHSLLHRGVRLWRPVCAHKNEAVVATYAIALALLKLHHEFWFDEIQAWLLAKDVPNVSTLFFELLRYEGSPGLWHMLLFPLARSGLPVGSMHVLSWIVAVTGVAILMRRAPFPFALKTLIAFSYFVFFQYAVVVRSYVLLPTLFFALAALYPHRKTQAETYAVLLILLSHVSVHAGLTSAVLSSFFIGERLLRHRRLRATQTKRTAVLVLALLLNYLLIAYQLMIPSDYLLRKPPLEFDYIRSTVLNAVDGSLAEYMPLSLAFLFSIGLLAYKRKMLLPAVLLPLPQLAVFSRQLFSPWHEGILALTWVFLLWILWEKNENDTKPRERLRIVGATVFACVLLIQVHWSYTAGTNDIRLSYSGSEKVAAYIKEYFPPEENVLYIDDFLGASVLGYFEENIFENYNFGKKPRYYVWSRSRDQIQQSWGWIGRNRPDLLVVSRKSARRDRMRRLIPYQGYTEYLTFTGKMVWKRWIYEDNSYTILVRNDRLAEILKTTSRERKVAMK